MSSKVSTADELDKVSNVIGLRGGTAIHNKGRERVNQILDASARLFAREGLAIFSVRKVSSVLGLNTRNVQYYFPTKKHLLISTVQYVFTIFAEEIDEFMKLPGRSPQERFISYVDYLLESIRDPLVRGFLLHTWSASASDGDVADMLGAVNGNYRKHLAELMKPLNPSLDEGERWRRAAILQAIIDGLILTVGPGGKTPADIIGVEKSVKAQALKLASEINLEVQESSAPDSLPKRFAARQ